jgi:recombination protein RecT
LADCDPNSVLLAACEAAEVGCNLAPSLALGWLIPYKPEVQFQPSYRFFIQKAYETREVKTFFAEVVYESDKFIREYAPKKNLFHAPGETEGPRSYATAIGAYAFIEFTDGTIDWEWLTKDQIERHRKHSKNANSIMWTSFWEEGWRKTPIRVIAKRLPMKNRDFEGLVEMINKDTDRDMVTVDDISNLPVSAEPKRLSEAEPQHNPAAAAAAASAGPEKAQPAQQAQPQAKQQPAKAATTSAPGMFAEEGDDPFLDGAEMKTLWDKAFSLGWSKKEVMTMLPERFGVPEPKDLHRSQLAKVLSFFEEPEPGANG